MSARSPLLLPGLFGEKCPKCRKGNIFLQKSVFPLSTCLRVAENCDRCGQKIKVENNYGQGMNFVFVVAVFIVTFLLYHIFLGITFRNNSVFFALGISVALSLLLQPWLMRLSRVLFLYLVIPFDKEQSAAV